MTEPSKGASVVQRAKDILVRPKETWARIDGEAATPASIYIPYVVLLAAIGPVALLIGSQIFGYGALGFRYRPGLGSAVGSALLSYVLTLVGVFVLALIIDALAPRFGGQKNQVQALKVAAYSGTAAWIAGIFGLVPALSMLGILGLYSLYLLYLGLPRLMKTPDDKALTYSVVVIVLAGLLFMVIGMISSSLVSRDGMFGGNAGAVTTPDGRRIDMGKVEGMAAAIGKDGARPAIPAASLSELLPETLAGMPRTSRESGQMAMGSMASADYARDGASISLSLVDLGVAGAMATMLAPQMEKESDGRYERMGRVDGRYIREEYDRNARRGSYGVLLADRVMVQAEGRGVDMQQLQAAVHSVDARRVERLAR